MIVNGHGPLTSSIAVVGHVPGEAEHDAGIPFCGPSGELLNEILRRAGLRRQIRKRYVTGRGIVVDVESDVYCTNIAKEWPGRDEHKRLVKFQSVYYEDKRGFRASPRLLQAVDELSAELAATSANVFIAAGEEALRALTGKYGVDKWRGSVLECTLVPGRKVVPMLHPASLFEGSYHYKPVCIFDAKRAARESRSREIVRPHRTMHLTPTLDDVLAWERRLCAAEYVSFDIETTIGTGHILCIGFADTPSEGICIPLANGRAHYWQSEDEEAAAWRSIANILGSPTSKKIAQNALFDCSHLATHGVRVVNLFHDTMLAAAILYPELEKGLGFLCSLYTEEPYYKDIGKRLMKRKKQDKEDWTPESVEQDQLMFRDYNVRDSCCTLEVAFGQMQDFREHARERVL